MSAEETIDSVTTHENSVSDASYKEDEEDDDEEEEEEDDIVDEALHGSDRSDAEDFQENKRIPAATLRPSPPSVSPSPSTKKKSKTLTSAQLEEEQLLKEQDAGLDAEGDDIMGADAPRLFLGDDADSKKVSVEWMYTPRQCIPAYFQLELADYQALGLEQLERAPNQAGILAADMGLGKTAQALGYICNRISRYEKEFKTKVGCQHLVQVPKSIAQQWEREFVKFVSPQSGIKLLNMTECITDKAIDEVVSGKANIVLTTPYRTIESLKTFCMDAGIKVWSQPDMHYKTTEQLNSVFKACSDWNKSACESLKEKFSMHFAVDGMNCELSDKRKGTGAATAWTFYPKWSTLIVDEAHSYRNSGNVGWRSLFGIRAESRVLLTATPLHNSLDDIYSYLRLIRVPSLVNTVTWLSSSYGAMKEKDAYLDRMCKGHLIWIRKGDIPNLNIVPKLNFHVVAPFSNKVEEKYYAAWSSMAGKFAKEVGTANKGTSKKLAHVKVRTAVLRCRQVCGAAFVLNDLNRCDGFSEKDYPGLNDKNGWAGLYSSKINAVVEIVKDHVKSGEKFTVVTYFKAMIDMIVERMEKEGIKAISYTGDMTTVQRDAAVERFKRDPSVSALVCSLSISVGLSLGWANRAIMVDPWWNPQISLQAENRVHRYDSKKEVRIDCIVMSGTIEEAISKIAQARLDLANQFHSVANLRELLRLKRFGGGNSAASARKHGTSLQSSSMPRYEALIKHAEVLWHKRSEKRVCEECMYEAGLKSLRQESADPKGDGRPLEEIAYLRVRNHHNLEEPTPGTKRRPIPLEDDKEPTSKKPLLRPEAPIPATLAPVPKALPTIRDLAKTPLPVAPLPAPAKLPAAAAAAAAVEPTKRKEVPSQPEGDAASKKPKQPIQEPPVSGVVALTEDTVGNLLQVLFTNVKVVLRVWPNTSKSDVLKVMAARVALDQSGANYQISYALASFDNLRRELTLYGGMTKAQRDVVDIAKPVFDATVISSMEESARTRADSELKAKQKMYAVRIRRLAGYSEGIPELVRLKRCFFENLLSNAVRNSRNLEHYLYDALDPILPLLVVAQIEMGAAYATGMPRFKSTLESLKPRRCEKALQFYESIKTITSSAFVRDGTHPHCTIQELGSTIHTGLMPLLVARVFLDLLGGDRNFRTHINEHSITVTTPEGFLIVQESTVSGSFFTVSLYDEGEPKRLFLTDLVFNGSGFNEQKIKSSLAESACEQALAKILESCLTEYPRYVLCPTWAHPAVETALSKHFPEKVYECVTFSKRISTISKDELPDNLKTILWPWWSEFVLVP